MRPSRLSCRTGRRAVADLPGGTLLAIQGVLGPDDDPDEGPPWRLTRPELDAFADDGLSQAVVEVRDGLWRAEFHRTTS